MQHQSPDDLLSQLEAFTGGGESAASGERTDTVPAAAASASPATATAQQQQWQSTFDRELAQALAPPSSNGSANSGGGGGGDTRFQSQLHAYRPTTTASAEPSASAAAGLPPNALRSAVLLASPAAVAATPNSNGTQQTATKRAAPHSSPSSFARMQSERDAAASADRMRALVLEELGIFATPAPAAAPAYTAATPAAAYSAAHSAVAAPASNQRSSAPSYALPTHSSSHSTVAAAQAAALAVAVAEEEAGRRQRALVRQMQLQAPRLRSAKKKTRASEPGPHPAPARRTASSSYVDLLASTLPLTLSQCSTCLVRVLRVLQSSTADAQAVQELLAILADSPPSAAASSASVAAADSAVAPVSAVPTPTLEQLVVSLQHDQDVLNDAQMRTPQAKMLSQIPRDGDRGIQHQRMQRLFRWHLANQTQRKQGTATNAAAANPVAAAPAAFPSFPASGSDIMPSAAADFPSFASAAAAPPVSIYSATHSRPSSGQRSPTIGGGATPSESGSTTSAAAAAAAASVWHRGGDGSSSVGSSIGSSSASMSVSSFFGATSRPQHPAAAVAIPVRRGRYEHMPSRLLDHFKPYPHPLPLPLPQPASTSSRSRSASRSRRIGGAETPTPRRRGGSMTARSSSASRDRTRSLERPSSAASFGSSASTGRATYRAPNSARRRSSSSSTSRRPRRASVDSLDDFGGGGPSTDRTLFCSTSTISRTQTQTPLRRTAPSAPPSLADSARTAVTPYTNMPSVQPPSLSVGAYSHINSKLQIAPVRQRKHHQHPHSAATEDSEPDAASSSSVADGAAHHHHHRHGHHRSHHDHDHDASSADAHAHAHAGGDIDLPENLNAMVAEIESMNSNLEDLLAREAAQEEAQMQRTQKLLSQRLQRTQQRRHRSRSGGSGGSRSRSRSMGGAGEEGEESLRDQSLRRPRAIFPGSAALYADDDVRAREVSEAAARRSRSRVRRGLDPAAPPHLYTALHRPSAGAASVLPSDPHAYQAPLRASSGVRLAGPPHVPQQRDMSYLDFETNLRHREASKSLALTLAGLPSPASHRRQAPTSPRRPPDMYEMAAKATKASRSRERSRSRSLTPAGSRDAGTGAAPLVPLRKFETVAQARPMSYLTPAANSELLRQTSTYALSLAGGYTGGSAQPSLSYVRSTPSRPDRHIVDRERLPQARPMAYLAPEVNTAHNVAARSWAKKISGDWGDCGEGGAGYVEGTPALHFRYDPATDPYLKPRVARTIATQARPMAYLSNETNARHLRQAQQREARFSHHHQPTPSSSSSPPSSSRSQSIAATPRRGDLERERAQTNGRGDSHDRTPRRDSSMMHHTQRDQSPHLLHHRQLSDPSDEHGGGEGRSDGLGAEEEDLDLMSPRTRRRMTEEAAQRHAAQQIAYEEAERQWQQHKEQRSPPAAGARETQHARTTTRQQPHNNTQRDPAAASSDPESADDVQSRTDEDDPSDAADYYRTLRSQQQGGSHEEAYDPLAAERATRSSNSTPNKRTHTLRPSKRQQ